MSNFESMSDAAIEEGMKKLKEFADGICKEDFKRRTAEFRQRKVHSMQNGIHYRCRH